LPIIYVIGLRKEKMKIERNPVPVIITLETQDEIDMMYAISNHVWITDVLPLLRPLYDKLKEEASPNYNKFFGPLDKMVKNGGPVGKNENA
jgi:hypothetical protein